MRTPSARPYVLLNMASSADGKIATANGAVASFGSAHDQRHLYDLRAGADAVLCGARTANAPDVTLGPGGPAYQRRRLRAGLSEFNLRVVVSGEARLSPGAAVFGETRSPLIVLVSHKAPERRCGDLRRAGAIVACFGKRSVDLPAALAWLHRRWNVRRLVCEGGAELNDAMFRAGLIDEVHLTLCPILLGGSRAPTLVEGLGIPRLASAIPLQGSRSRRIGDELFLELRVGDENRAGIAKPLGPRWQTSPASRQARVR